MRSFEKYYFAIWCMFMPVTSLVVIPAVQGTIIAYIFGLASIGFVVMKISYGRMQPEIIGYFKSFLMVIALWCILLVGSQISDIIHPIDLTGMFAISYESRLLLHASLFTQSLYLIACVMIALYFRYFVPEEWLKYVDLGAWFFAIYGLYDWTFYLATGGVSGDFISNRSFAEGDHPGSWSQAIAFGPLTLLRLKSCLGEPSFVSAVVIPYLLMAIEGRKKVLATLLLICAVLTTSTTVYLGMAISFFIQTLSSKQNRGPMLVVLCIIAVSIYAMAVFFPDTFRSLFWDKISGDTDSGKIRLNGIDDYMNLLGTFNVFNWVFGIGFGYLYYSLGWSLTANTGLIGDGSFLYTLLKPAYLLPREKGSEWLKISMVTLVVVILLSVSEMFIPTTWMFIGLAYRRLDIIKARRLRARNAVPPRPPTNQEVPVPLIEPVPAG